MSTGACEKRTRLLEMYQANLERQIQQGDCNPVCRDEELCKEAERCLSKGSYHDAHSQHGLDALSVIETSLQALPVTSGQAALERLAKAFEVLELASVNLYLCPWRKEYRVVKMFSGMFTHYIKPALTSQQAEELFGLLGYEPGGAGEAEQLKLASGPRRADALLQLAYAFFTARVECRLLRGAGASLGHGAEGELQLVRERRHGYSLKVALDRARRDLEAARQASNRDLADLDTADLDTADLYTDQNPKRAWQTECDPTTAPPNYLYITPEETPSPRMSQSESASDENPGKAQSVCVSTVTYQTGPKLQQSPTQKPAKTSDNEKQAMAVGSQMNAPGTEQAACSCVKSYDSSAHRCFQCREVHAVDCPCFRVCREQGHDLRRGQDHRKDMSWQDKPDPKRPSKDALTTHSCMDNSLADVFVVCHSCHNIHDFVCEDFKRCRDLGHNVQATGRLQTHRGEADVTPSPQRHSCLSTESPDFVVCHTCNKSHDYLCEETQLCQRSDHAVKYQVELKKERSSVSTPMPFHECCTSAKPDFACLTCKVFHARACGEQCHRIKHRVQKLLHVCVKCAGAEVHTLCRHCCIEYCKACWFENPINCKCGMLFEHV